VQLARRLLLAIAAAPVAEILRKSLRDNLFLFFSGEFMIFLLSFIQEMT
jgi:hypothetical protein